MINKQSKLPIYYQLEEAIKQEISQKGLAPHSPIPSEREYAEKHGISRMTVRQAINNLVSQGILYRARGRGTFISEQKFEQDISQLSSFSEDMRERNLTPSTKIIKMDELIGPSAAHDKLNLKINDTVYEIVRLRLANDQPIALETIFTPKKLLGAITEKQVETSFYQYLENDLGLSIKRGFQSIEASLATSEEMTYLQIKKNDPVLVMQRTSFLDDHLGTPIEFVKSIYRADRYKFNIEMNRS
ncbi:HTH-type transcriptional repressor YvoA [Halolactibacillus alkaliphilus]|uniref:HTH-type transcriptional repressor YvoA n=1 Tax=Halolactibacillus alkaliphilus TaxID=442899 RepID=A0A511WZ73_9BACI|nr:GntR family transcriptional regulator [Halolactibacillus alkaliphilus]GEN55662.1 HTH-type transcriptional repressor YvoA [Halolactibacillus alkaliphilus]GGN63545.1 HTH-type transcriptional repressor YvoA [Halolactibacillus alkaliphilus]SFO62920.1 transcriptional regulator, GntR family [Halolactibacillus alkaliphilus]